MKLFRILFTVLSMTQISFAQKTASVLIPFRDHDKWGYSDISSIIIIQPQFDTTRFFVSYTNYINSEANGSHELALIRNKNKQGMIAPDGKIIIPVIYDEFRSTGFGYDSLLFATKKGKMGIINHNNKILVGFEYDNIVCDNYYVFKNHYQSIRFIGLKNKKEYQLYLNGETKKISTDYDPSVIMDRMADMAEYSNERIHYSPTDTLKKYGIEKMDDKEIVPYHGYYRIYKNGSVGAYNKKGIILLPQYDEITDFGYGYFLVKKNNQFAAISYKGEIKMPYTSLDSASICYDNVIIVLNTKQGVYDMKANLSLPPMYDSIEKVYAITTPSLWLVTKNGKQGFVNINGTEYFKD